MYTCFLSASADSLLPPLHQRVTRSFWCHMTKPSTLTWPPSRRKGCSGNLCTHFLLVMMLTGSDLIS